MKIDVFEVSTNQIIIRTLIHLIKLLEREMITSNDPSTVNNYVNDINTTYSLYYMDQGSDVLDVAKILLKKYGGENILPNETVRSIKELKDESYLVILNYKNGRAGFLEDSMLFMYVGD